ncbi:MAG: GrpB family protein [Clostridiales bacterium]|nr:GrpB family protein [Clostridiales bacterium]
MLGLKRGIVELYPHEADWETNAARTIAELREVFGANALDIQHVGSTSIRSICAKPIIDIAVNARSIDWFCEQKDALIARGMLYRGEDVHNEILFMLGTEEIRTHHIHICRPDSEEWRNYVRFRDYLNANREAAKEYEALKLSLAREHSSEREAYTLGKAALIARLLTEAKEWEKKAQ